ncbi:MAG: ATP synthase subunit I [Thermodesulfobacteriota bacterium]|nr:ATP synthase subunit I [Thermodesulfobacteriota bacterium]
MNEIHKEQRMTAIERNNAIIFAVLALGSIFFKSLAVTLGVVIGGIIIIVNFWFLRKIAERIIKKSDKGAFFVFSYIFKFIALIAILFVVIYSGIVDIIGLIVGLSTVFLGIALDGFVQVFKRT